MAEGPGGRKRRRKVGVRLQSPASGVAAESVGRELLMCRLNRSNEKLLRSWGVLRQKEVECRMAACAAYGAHVNTSPTPSHPLPMQSLTSFCQTTRVARCTQPVPRAKAPGSCCLAVREGLGGIHRGAGWSGS